MFGSVAADRADTGSMEGWLEKHGLIQEGEHVLGTELSVAQLPASGESFVQVAFLVASIEADLRIRIPGADEPPTLLVRRIERDFSLVEFFSFFKRFQLTLSASGEFEGRTYTHIG